MIIKSGVNTLGQRGSGITAVAVLMLMAILTTFTFIQRQTTVHERQVAITRGAVPAGPGAAR